MDERWGILARVRGMRARLALNEAARRGQVEARARAALEQTQRVQAYYTELAVQASAAASLYGSGGGNEPTFSAADAQVLHSYVTGARLKAQESAGPVRRAQLVFEHAQTAADEARQNHRRAADRHETVVSRWKENLRVESRRRSDREDETSLESLSARALAARDDGQ